jgi:anti-sigma factor RsiW
LAPGVQFLPAMTATARRNQDLSSQETIVDYLDGRMDRAHREAFEELLAADRALAREVEELRELRGLLGGGPEPLSA